MASILIIDDDPIYAGMLEQRLARAGHQVTVHLSPFGSTVAARRPGLDLVVLDVFMPGLDGPALLEVMRRDAVSARPKVMFCSSMDAASLRELAARHQVQGFVPKSALREHVLESVERVLRSSRA
jgi:two-component system response regulator PfeR